MSMNIFIVAERDIFFERRKSSGGVERCKDVQKITFEAIQTPTNVTYKIIDSRDPAQAYIDYVKTCSNPIREPVYANDDVFGEHDPIGYQDYDWAEEHIERFRDWHVRAEQDGYTVKFEVI